MLRNKNKIITELRAKAVLLYKNIELGTRRKSQRKLSEGRKTIFCLINFGLYLFVVLLVCL